MIEEKTIEEKIKNQLDQEVVLFRPHKPPVVGLLEKAGLVNFRVKGYPFALYEVSEVLVNHIWLFR